MRTLLTVAWLAGMATAVQAAPLLAPEVMRPVVAATAQVETVACVRGGWRGAGVYPGCALRPGYPVRPYYAPYYAPRRYYARPGYPIAPYFVAPRVVVAGPAYVPVPARQCWIAGAWRPC